MCGATERTRSWEEKNVGTNIGNKKHHVFVLFSGCLDAPTGAPAGATAGVSRAHDTRTKTSGADENDLEVLKRTTGTAPRHGSTHRNREAIFLSFASSLFLRVFFLGPAHGAMRGARGLLLSFRVQVYDSTVALSPLKAPPRDSVYRRVASDTGGASVSRPIFLQSCCKVSLHHRVFIFSRGFFYCVEK